MIDELRLSRTARYDRDFAPDSRFEPDSDTLALYHFDEGEGDALNDSSGNGYHGKIVGAKWVKVGGTPVTSQRVSREAELKSQLVSTLGRLVAWPDDVTPAQGKPLTIGILGSDPFVDVNGVNHLKVNVPEAVILKLSDSAEIKACHILFVAKDADLAAALARVQGLPILVVGESPGLAKQGAMVNLVFDAQQNRIRMEINQDTAIGAGLELNEALLSSPLVEIIH